MEFILPDGRKAKLTGNKVGKSSEIELEDGRLTYWPTDKIPQQKEGDDTLKLVQMSAMDRLSEWRKDIGVLQLDSRDIFEGEDYAKFQDFYYPLLQQAVTEFKQKWGLT